MFPNGREECLPLHTLDEVLKWNPSNTPDWSERGQPLRKRTELVLRGSKKCSETKTRLNSKDVPRTLFCHDMKGGYLEDRFVEGSDEHESYRFFRWAGIDTFVYFSHCLVTIPPLSWINAGHCNGVPVLGTIITEGTKGRELWQKVLATETLSNAFMSNLALICLNYGFDGYLLNIETSLDPDDAFRLYGFFKNLKAFLSELKPDSTIIWYDAITLPSGHLAWQNCLTYFNYHFFDICDGIFLNYIWSEEDLQKTVFNARNRKFDVYVGVDIFGRKCYGGGGFNTCVAVDLIRKYDLSVALFAPGWVHENKQAGENFLDRDLMFWNLLIEQLYLHGVSELPLVTSFCQGYGKKLYKSGKVVSDKPWYNLSKQNYQPTDLYGHLKCFGEYCLKHNNNDAYNGGSSLLVSSCNISKHVHRLFLLCYKVDSVEELEVTIVTKCTSPDSNASLVIVLDLEDSLKRQRKIKLTGLKEQGKDESICSGDVILPEIEMEGSRDSWTERKYKVSIAYSTILEVGFYIIGGKNILFGQFSIDKVSS